MERNDVVSVGPITPSVDGNRGELFTMSAQVYGSDQLHWFCYSISTMRILLSTGILGSGLQGEIHADIRPVYFAYSVNPGDSPHMDCYSDIRGTDLIGYLSRDNYYSPSTDGDRGERLAIDDYYYGIILTPNSPSSYPESDILLSGVKYVITSNVIISTVPSYAGENQLSGITRGFNLPAASPRTSMADSVSYRRRIYNNTVTKVRLQPPKYSGARDYYPYELAIQLHPISIYDPAYFCNRITETMGYLPQTMVTAQCQLVPDSNFGQSSYCANQYLGLTTRDECEDINFRYYYAVESCGDSYEWTNFLGEPVTVESSMGEGCEGQCALSNNQFQCVGGTTDDSSLLIYPRTYQPEEEQDTIEPSGEVEIRLLSVIAIIILLAIVAILVIMLLMMYTADKDS